MKQYNRVISLAAAISLLAVHGAGAADYEPELVPIDPVIEEYQPVEIGSGWYIRGDVGYTMNDPFVDLSAPAPVGFHIATPINGSVGFGYQFNDWFRTEFAIGYIGEDSFGNTITECEGTETVTTIAGSTSGPSTRPCTSANRGKNTAWDSMASAYVDLGTYVGFTPYVGAGIGLAYTTYYSDDRRDCVGETVVSGGTTTEFTCAGAAAAGGNASQGGVTSGSQLGMTWAAMAGIGYQISKNTKVDVGYRYSSIPGAVYVYDNSGQHAFGTGVTSHQIRVGLRYEIW